MGLSSFGCNDNFYCYVGAVLHSFKAIAFPIPRLSYDLYRFEVKDFKTDMISNELWFKRQKSPFHVSFGVLFFCNHIHPRPSKRSYRTRKKGKNKQTQGSAHLPKSAASLSNKISAKIFKMAPVTINDPNGTSWTVPIFRRNWQKWNWKEIDLLNNRVTSLRSFTGIRFVENDDCFRSTGIWTRTERREHWEYTFCHQFKTRRLVYIEVSLLHYVSGAVYWKIPCF